MVWLSLLVLLAILQVSSGCYTVTTAQSPSPKNQGALGEMLRVTVTMNSTHQDKLLTDPWGQPVELPTGVAQVRQFYLSEK